MTVHETGRDGEEPFEDGEGFAEDGAVETEELALVDDDEPLPWLESDYGEEDESYNPGNIAGFIFLALLALAAIIGLVWWLSNPGADPELVADGSTIEAPDGPTKERPEDPGGKEFEGTGNVAPGVGQGETTEGRLAGDDSARPSIDTATPNNAGQAGAGNASGGAVGVQVGAYRSKDSATKAWGTLNGQTQALNGFKYRVVEGEVDGGTVFRLQAVAGDTASANRLCNALKADGIECQVKN
ncbi:SPOR domain-containing protein [Altererythrobacter aquaemixtae]|uniref:SPOR domain-containing protein n=2 Tax=Pontixanthobacter aquaemixtae TaxID=1958940 RepID=A0A844ZP41_9SPHN|nr:SPOR domain-containing protein [Pontixanthobacter aquaemixtae]